MLIKTINEHALKLNLKSTSIEGEILADILSANLRKRLDLGTLEFPMRIILKM
jgi:hypothetical protein